MPRTAAVLVALLALSVLACDGDDRSGELAQTPLVTGETIAVRFAQSVDVAWYTAPKLSVGQAADLALAPDTLTEVAGEAFIVVDPESVGPAGPFSGSCVAGDRVVTGEVATAAPLAYPRAGTEHEPDWAEADVVITAVICDDA
jgi:hypothetical protein